MENETHLSGRSEQIIYSEGRRVQFTLDPDLPAFARRQMQKPYAHIQRHSPVPRGQALGLHAKRLVVRHAVILRVDHAEVETMPVLDRRSTVWIQQIALVEHGVGDSFYKIWVHQ